MQSIRILRLSALSAAIGLAVSSAGYADTNVATQTVGYQVDEVALIRFDPGPYLTIDGTGMVAGESVLSSVMGFSNWSITSNKGQDAKKLTAQLDQPMPNGVQLLVTLMAPAGASGTQQFLTEVATDVVTGIDPVASSGLPMTYHLQATIEAGLILPSQVTVTYTLVDS